MTQDQLIASAQALLDLDARGALVPHGIGGHARTIIEGFLALHEPAASLAMIADIAEGSTSANSLPHIAKIARAAPTGAKT